MKSSFDEKYNKFSFVYFFKNYFEILPIATFLIKGNSSPNDYLSLQLSLHDSILHIRIFSIRITERQCFIIYNNDRYVFIYLSHYLYVTLCQWYLWVKSIKVSCIPRFYRSPLEHFFSYYYTIFKLILFQYDTSLSNNFCGRYYWSVWLT